MLSKIKAVFDEKYRSKWKISKNHRYYHLGINNIPINNNIYKDGVFSSFNPKQEFSLVMKGIEDFYTKSIIDYTKSTPEHISDVWTVLNNKGEEIMSFGPFNHLYLDENSCVLFGESKYYNLRTIKEYPFKSRESFSTSKYLFVYDYKKVYKIDKQTGEYETFE